MTEKKYPNNIKHLRMVNKLYTRDSFAEALQVSPTSITNYEQGKQLPTLPILMRLCQVLNAPVEAIYPNWAGITQIPKSSKSPINIVDVDVDVPNIDDDIMPFQTKI